MTFNDNARVGGNSAKRRGGGTVAAVGGGAVGLGAVVVLLFSLFTGTDLTGLIGGGTAAGPESGGEAIANCETVPTRTATTRVGWPRHPSTSISSGSNASTATANRS